MRSTLRLSTVLFSTAHGVSVHNAAAARKPAVSALMESAKNFLKNGVTPDVVTFAQETLAEVTGQVIPAIENESTTDQQFITALHSQFAAIHAELTTRNLAIHTLNVEERNLRESHRTCRSKTHGSAASEEAHCESKRACEMHAYGLWELYATCEGIGCSDGQETSGLCQNHWDFQNHFCPNNGTVHDVRTATVEFMDEWQNQERDCVSKKDNFNTYMATCIEHHDALTTVSDWCNDNQTALQNKACEHATAIADTVQWYYESWAHAEGAYQCAVQEIEELESDRHQEWKTLQVVNCLLERVHEQNGRPCDSETGDVDEQVTTCEQRHAVDVCDPDSGNPILCIDYHTQPPAATHCSSRDDVVGVCEPTQIPVPCTDGWDQEQYMNVLTADGQTTLREWPAPEFSSSNPGCNAWDTCTACGNIATPVRPTLDFCPGYTSGSCAGNPDDPHVFVRDVAGTADVRCCSIDGDICEAKPSTVPEACAGAVHSNGCVVGVTYQEALAVCQANGMRVCRTEEATDSCCADCPTNPVWVDLTHTGSHINTHNASRTFSPHQR
jgi:hypothetical protein